eukprot:UN26656
MILENDKMGCEATARANAHMRKWCTPMNVLTSLKTQRFSEFSNHLKCKEMFFSETDTFHYP